MILIPNLVHLNCFGKASDPDCLGNISQVVGDETGVERDEFFLEELYFQRLWIPYVRTYLKIQVKIPIHHL